MIITKKVKIFVHNTKVKYYQNLGYDILKGGEKIEVNIEHLTPGSHCKITTKCDFCGEFYVIRYEKYLLNIERNNGFYSCKKCRPKNTEKTKKQRYGDGKFCNKEKIKKTLQEKYGQDSPMKIEQFKEKQKRKMEDLGLRPKRTERKEWQNYRIDVYNETYKNKKILFKKWNGLDYYDNEYIKDNFVFSPTNPKYPTIDHKISILYGFKNSIPPKEIGSIENLCITKKSNNSNKNSKTEKEFKQFLFLALSPQDNKDIR